MGKLYPNTLERYGIAISTWVENLGLEIAACNEPAIDCILSRRQLATSGCDLTSASSRKLFNKCLMDIRLKRTDWATFGKRDSKPRLLHHSSAASYISSSVSVLFRKNEFVQYRTMNAILVLYNYIQNNLQMTYRITYLKWL